MKLRFIEGAAGSGKTHLCLSQMADCLRETPLGAPLLLIVPEQATFQAERALAAFPGVGASLRAEVLSFSGLYRWLAAEHTYPALPWLDEQGRSMLLLACLQQKLDDLQLLKPSAKNAGFMDLLARTLVEFEQYNVTPQMLSAAASHLPAGDMLPAKLADLAVIYRAYLDKIAGGFRDQGVMMQELRQAAAASRRLVGARVWIDGFMDMNPSQMAVIREIFAKAQTLTVTFTLPDLGAHRIFGGQRRLREQFMQLAPRHDKELSRLTTETRRFANDELRAVEVCFANGEFAPATPDEPRHVHLFAAETPADEAELAAQLICRLTQENKLKFRDIAVVTRNIDDYRPALENAFRDFNIPYFFDMGRNVSHHPLVKLVAEVLSVLYDNWATPSVLAYLKSGLAGIQPDEADILENYALRVGLKGKMWQQAGSFRRGSADELPGINAIAERALSPLLALDSAVQSAATVGDIAAALLAFLSSINAADHMEEWAQNAVQAGDLVQAEAHRQIFEKVQRLLAELSDFLGDMPADARRFAEFWHEGAARLALSSIPPAADQINVADISRSHLPKISAAIVLGLAEGTLPALAEENGLLASHDKEQLAQLGIDLPPGGRTRQFAEDYLLYLAFTRAGDELYLTYPRHAADGTPKNPSPALASLSRIFPALKAQTLPPLYRLGGPRSLLKGLSAHLAALRAGQPVSPADDSFWRGVCQNLKATGQLAPQLELLQSGLAYQVDTRPLDARRLAALYPDQDHTSVSRLERFNNCPCQYFAQYGLALAPRDEFKLRTVDVGTLYHYVLAEVIAALTAADTDWAALTADELLPLINRTMQDFAQNGLADIFADSGKNAYAAEKIRTVLLQTLLDMAHNLAAGSFRPVALELSFGRGGSAVKPMYINLPDGRKIRLVGQIDRVDAATGSTGEYLRIIDYKMSNKTLKLADIYYGLNWQMPLYLDALLASRRQEGARQLPAGMFYVPVQEVIKSVKAADDEGASVKLQGLAILDIEAITLAERDFEPGSRARTMKVHLKKDNTFGVATLGLAPAQYAFVQDCLKRDAGSALQAMLLGDVSQRPVVSRGRAACEFCDFYPICALDLAVEPKMREAKDLSSAQVIDMFCAKYPDLAQKHGISQNLSQNSQNSDKGVN